MLFGDCRYDTGFPAEGCGDRFKQFNFEMDEMDIEHYIRYHQLSNQPERVVGLVNQK